ncbi:poly-beta-hydroxybutyrate-responsive repressor [Bacillus sp. AGMB 02131]|uniref:Poly-beta-hydroxybutyrate-responsive repressor n=1 Tax=Peribacillus faecalis TaxID=2772559 RepID=A0A927CUZ1_9BACI|nr:poly-beta-hydroxybutyrate-responsive repressor [Peribacillus faecalis]MBD3108302.1 poly-beta-hydroxybutyrate-responsive repressor [Peribacillus faecalis]
MDQKPEETKVDKTTKLATPKNFLIPIMLLHLREWSSHGYELMEKITEFGVESVDQGNFYRLLRQLEKDALVTSEWNVSSGGPAKRIYSITEAGERYLETWAGSLSYYQKMLDQFFNLYNPFFTPYRASTQSKNEED